MRSQHCFETLETRHLMASDWQNGELGCDVDNSALVTHQDVLYVINELNRHGSRWLPPRGQHSDEPFYDVDGDGMLSPLDPLRIINAINLFGNTQPAIVGGMSPASDPNHNGVVQSSQVTIYGQTLARSMVTVTVDGIPRGPHTILADEQGRFSVEIAVELGLQTAMVSARDELGRTASQSIDIRRGNTIQDWNASILNIVRQWTTTSNDPYLNRIVPSQPPMVARNLAMIHAAMFDAVNAVTGGYQGYRFHETVGSQASADAAAAMAAFEVAKALYSAVDEIAVWQASLDEALVHVPDGSAKSLGIELGKRVGQTILADRANDGSRARPTYSSSGDAGDWRRTFPDFLPPLLAQWPNVKPFAMTDGAEFRPAPPPSLDSSEYAAAVDEVLRKGGYQSSERTAEQTEIALFWADGAGTATPPGHWNSIATDVTLQEESSLLETARTFALLNIAMADAGIASWDAKYHYDLWRPIDAIRLADLDGNEATARVASWIPLLKTPPFPAYTSGHSTFSGAASTVLTNLFGENFEFESTSDGHLAAEQRPLDPSQIVTRRFSSFNQAAIEAGLSRIYGGIHFRFDDAAGRALGNLIAEVTLRRF